MSAIVQGPRPFATPPRARNSTTPLRYRHRRGVVPPVALVRQQCPCGAAATTRGPGGRRRVGFGEEMGAGPGSDRRAGGYTRKGGAGGAARDVGGAGRVRFGRGDTLWDGGRGRLVLATGRGGRLRDALRGRLTFRRWRGSALGHSPALDRGRLNRGASTQREQRGPAPHGRTRSPPLPRRWRQRDCASAGRWARRSACARDSAPSRLARRGPSAVPGPQCGGRTRERRARLLGVLAAGALPPRRMERSAHESTEGRGGGCRGVGGGVQRVMGGDGSARSR